MVPVAKRVTLASSLVKYYSRYMIQEIFIYIFTCDLLLDLLASAYFIYCLVSAYCKRQAGAQTISPRHSPAPQSHFKLVFTNHGLMK